jgi:SAM-dependent methyltransferase
MYFSLHPEMRAQFEFQGFSYEENGIFGNPRRGSIGFGDSDETQKSIVHFLTLRTCVNAILEEWPMFVRGESELMQMLDEFTPGPTDYFRHGAKRIAASINMIPEGSGTILELGCDCHFSLAMSELTNYEIIPQNSPSPIACAEDVTDPTVTFTRKDSSKVQFERKLFDLDSDPYPFPDNSIDGVVCCEVLEHLFRDPAWMLREVNRVLKPGGWFLVTTPNLTSYHSIRRAVMGIHPLQYSNYYNVEKYPGLSIQHTREYAFWELIAFLEETGFGIIKKETRVYTVNEQLGVLDYLVLIPATLVYNLFKFRNPKHLQLRYRLPNSLVLARKDGAPKSRFPTGFYVQ